MKLPDESGGPFMLVRPRTVRALVLAATVVAGALLLGGCDPAEVPPAVSGPSPIVSPADQAATGAVADDASTATGGSTTTVTRGIDGDTFVIAGAAEVR